MQTFGIYFFQLHDTTLKTDSCEFHLFHSKSLTFINRSSLSFQKPLVLFFSSSVCNQIISIFVWSAKPFLLIQDYSLFFVFLSVCQYVFGCCSLSCTCLHTVSVFSDFRPVPYLCLVTVFSIIHCSQNFGDIFY